MRKYTTVESVKVLPQQEQERISAELHKLGKTSARDLTEEERKQALDSRTND
jgi:hypothetical protein